MGITSLVAIHWLGIKKKAKNAKFHSQFTNVLDHT